MKCLTAKANRRIIIAVGSLAQLVEQLTFNQLVAGSNPARPTNKIKHLDYIKYILIIFTCHIRAINI